MKRGRLRVALGICYMFCLFLALGIWKCDTQETAQAGAREMEGDAGEEKDPVREETPAELVFETESEETAREETLAEAVENPKELAQEEAPAESAEDPGERPRVALTFDDGPRPETTAELLDGLKERGVRATFFVIGKCAQEAPELVRREAEEGHIVGNHTWNHVQLTRVTEQEARREITDTSDLVQQLTGSPTEYARPPFGSWPEGLEQELEVMPVLWSVDPLDWTTKNVDEIVRRVVTETEDGAIILLHDCYDSSVKAALQIVDILQRKGYDFVTVDELLLG